MATLVNDDGTTRTDNRYRIPEDICRAIWACARGVYQHGLLDGTEAWSGAGLSGEAQTWSSSYARSRDNLLDRIFGTIFGSGWKSRTELVLKGSPRRWQRELVLTNPNGIDLVW